MAAQKVEDIFADIVERAKELDPVNSRAWFDKLTALRLNGGTLEIGCPDEATAQYLRDNCKDSFMRAAQQLTGHLVGIDFNVDGGQKRQNISVAFGVESKLHPDYTFDNFVVGPCNRLAHASCVAISQSPGSTYNPLFIYGSSGLGKTHLLQAVCYELNKKINNAVIYCSKQQF